MSLSNLTVADLRQLEKLLSRKEQLQGEIADIDQILLRMDRDASSGGNGSSVGGRPRGRQADFSKLTYNRKRAAGGGRKGVLKAKIIRALKAAGKDGMHVKELAKKLKANEPNIRVWFYATGKKIDNVKQIKPATYRWVD